MLSAIKSLLGLGPAVDYKELLSQGGKIIDVRTPSEFSSGHIKGSINIPLDSLQSKMKKLPKDKPLVLCCASGMRSGAAKGMLKSKGYTQVYNGKSWMSLERKVQKG